MSTEKLVEGLGRQIGRRDFLKRLGAGTISTLLALQGYPARASGGYCQGFYSYKCSI